MSLENLLKLIAFWMEQDSTAVLTESMFMIDLTTVEVANTNKFGKLMYCDQKYWNETLERINWN